MLREAYGRLWLVDESSGSTRNLNEIEERTLQNQFA